MKDSYNQTICYAKCAVTAEFPFKKCFVAFRKQFLKIRANLTRHNRVYILSSKHTSRRMTAYVVAQLFFND